MKYKLISSSPSNVLDKPYKDLDQGQLKAVKSPDVPLLIVAGAGTGKTKTLINRAAHILLNGGEPGKMMICTFTLKSAREMKTRLSNMLGEVASNVWAGTFHHLGHRLLRKYGNELELGNDFSILDREDVKDLLSSILRTKKTKSPLTPNKLLGMFSTAIGTQTPLYKVISENHKELKKRTDEIIELFSLFQEKKLSQKVVDFDDLLAIWKHALIENEGVSESIRNSFTHLLVDEYQDINQLQADIIDLMVQDHHCVTVVGDDAQSIYSFRGANPGSLLNFKEKYENSILVKLETNYRSTQPILDLANITLKKSKTLIPKQLKSFRGDGIKPVLIKLSDSSQEANFVAQRLWELHTEENIPLHEIAVLYRTNQKGIEIQLELSKRGIPYKVTGGHRFFEQAHFKDFISYLRVALNPHDEMALLRLFKFTPGLGIAGATKFLEFLEDFVPEDEDHPLSNSSFHNMFSKTTKKKIIETGSLFNTLKKQKNEVSKFFQYVYNHYKPVVERKFENYAERLEELDELVSISGQYDSVDRVLSDLGLQLGPIAETMVQLDEPQDNVVLSTVHQAKGLEWKVVFIISLSEGTFPIIYGSKTVEELEEERRIFHVAVTRARDQLYLTHPVMTGPSDRQRIFKRISRFIKEIPSNLYDEWELEIVSPD
jgi:ATP-dependent DNA helicase UvrD/PcrA